MPPDAPGHDDLEDDATYPPDVADVRAEGDDPAAPPLPARVVERFLGKQRALDIAASVIGPIVPEQHVGDLAADTVVQALRAPPPHLEAVLVTWLSTIARRVAAAWLEKRRRRSKYEGPMPTRASQEDAYTGHAVEDASEAVTHTLFDEQLEEEAEDLIDPFLESIVSERDRPILEIIRQHAAEKKTYKAIAAERKMTEDQLDARLRRFTAKYEPRVRKRRSVMLWLKLGGLVLLLGVAAVLYVVFGPKSAPPVDVLPDPSTRPLPSASASAEPAPLVAERLRQARELRDAALGSCRDAAWRECLEGLDAARALDPAGDTAPAVQSARAQARQQLSAPPPKPDKPAP